MRIAPVLLLAAACACGAPPAADETLSDSAAPLTSSSAAADSVVSAQAAPAAPAPVAQDTGYTPWRAVEMPSEPWTQRASTPAALLTRVRDVVAAQLEEPDAGILPTRMVTQQADSAVGVLVEPVTGDDSVRETEFRVHMRREGAEWAVVAVERRERCWRGVADGGLCA